jgi:subtilisin family serine protease
MVTSLVAGLATMPGSAGADPGSDPEWTVGTQAVVPAGEGHRVTLLTGDRVYVDGDRVAISAAAGREQIGFSQYEVDGHQYVLPNDALRLVSAGEVDERLFDVTGLVDAGYHDAAERTLPLIVEYDDRAAGSAKLRAAGQPKVTRSLPSVGGAAVRVGKSRADEFWSGVTTRTGTAAGISTIWLDAKLEVSLDESVPQIGAPAAWQAGYDGAGVTVAVLDTGIDATHPDLADRIAAAENFTNAPDTNDLVGHGTHVASTVVGSGAASGGTYQGVAPGASLLVGKVCPDRFCAESAILAGMEWAAPRAEVVNMSLGGWDSPGIDPLEEAVNRLTAQTGALFVVAAGNEGRRGGVGSPASADAALAVGAVDKQENIADFSNQGPNVEDGDIKPDVTAPGVGIVAALAADGGYPEFEPGYTQLDGTSMATPHVAGAAALLAQQHPDWSATELKAALMGSAQPNPALSVFAQGSGRIDLARAVDQPVLPSPTSLSLGTQPWPAEDDEPITASVTYRNDGPEPVTLDLAADVTGPDGNPAPAGMFTTSPGQVTVPAGGSAEVALTADTRVPSATGTFTGALTASGGDTVVRVPLVVTKGHESRTLTIRHIDRNGDPATDYATSVVGVDEPVFRVPYSDSGTVSQPLDVGRYYIQSTIITPEPGGGSSTLLVQPTFTLAAGGDVEIVLDARAGTPVSVSAPRESAGSRLASAGLARGLPSGYYLVNRIIGDTFEKLYTVDLGGEVAPDAGTLVSDVRSFWAERGADGTFDDSPYEYALVWFQRGRFLTDFHRTVAQAELATVVNRFHAVSATGSPGYMWSWGLPPEGGSALAPRLDFTVPGSRTIYYSAEDVSWAHRWEEPGGGQYWQDDVTFRPGKRYQVGWQQAPLGPRFSERVYLARRGNTIQFNLPPFGDQAGHAGYSWLDTGRMTFYQDDRLLAELPTYFYDAGGPVPPAESTYRLEYETTRGGAGQFDIGTEISGSWTFRSGEVGTDRWTSLPVSAVSFEPDLDLTNAAPGGRVYRVPVSLQRQPGAAASVAQRVTVEVSYDDGESWRRVPLAPAGRDEWTAVLRHPRNGYVSLRAHASFADGSTVDYTVLHAYRLE